MNNKKIQAHMQLNVSFVSDAAKMVKDLQSSLKSLDFSSGFTKQIKTNLDKSFKDTLTNLDKMADGLSKKGLNPKQYMDFFTAINAKIEESTHFFGKLKQGFQDVYNSKENQDAIKNLEQLKKKLEEVNKVVTNQKKLQTRQQTAKDKIKDLTGYDYDSIKGELSKLQKRKATGKDLTPGQEKWLYSDLKLTKEQATELFKVLKQIDNLMVKEKENTALSQGKFNAAPLTAQAGIIKDIDKLESQILTKDVLKNNVSVITLLENKLLGAANATNLLTTGMNTEIPKATAEAERLAKASSTINEILGQFGISFTAATVIRGFQDLIKEAFNFYKSLDSALNEIYVVSNLSSEAVNNLKTDFITMAKDTGMALDDITRSAVLFYQQGLTTDEVMEMTRVTSEFAKVAGIDAADAADKLTAAVNGYCLAAEDAAMVADKFNKVAAASAADIDELSTAFSKAAAQANQAGVGMDNYLAYIATMVEATREAPENIGTSLKTIMSRMQQVKESGTTEDGETDVNKVETALRSVGVALRDTNGELRDLEDVFGELGPKWQSLDRNTQAYLGTIIAGTRQQSRFITLMQNWDRVLDLANQSANSAGQQALMHAKAMDSIESKVQQFQVAWQEFISNLTDSDVIKGIVSLLTKLVDVFNGGNKPVMTMAMAVGLLSTKLKDLQEAGVGKVKTWWSDRQETKSKNIEARTASRADSQYYGLEIAKLEKQIKEEQLQLERLITEEKEKQNGATTTQIEETKNKIKNDKRVLKNYKNKKDSSDFDTFSTYGQTITEVGIAVNMASMALSSYDENLAGIVGSMGSMATAIGQFATGNYVGAAISLVTAVYQAVQTFSNWEENIAAKLSEAANKVEKAAQEAANLNTGIKSSESLVKEYDKLSRKMNRTAAEQERLNAVVQQLGDTHKVDVLTDSYGNLSLSIDEVTNSIQKLKDDRDKAVADLQKEETTQLLKATGSITNTNTIEDYYNEILTGSKTTYKSLLSGVEENMSDEVRSISSSLASEFSSNFTESIYNEVANNAKGYTGSTLIGAMRDYDVNINTKLDNKDWNELYAQIGELENEVNDMSYNEVQAKLESFYDTWGKANDITLEEWNILKDSINNTIFDNKSLLQFYGKVSEMNSKASGDYYNNKISKLETQIKDVDESSAALEGSNWAMAGGGALGGLATFGAINGWNPVGWGALAVAGVASIASGIALMNTEESKMQRALNKTKKELEKEREEYLKKIDEENKYLDGTEDAKTWIDAQIKVADTLKTLNNEQQNYLGNINSLFNFEGLRADESTSYANVIEDMIKGMSDLTTDTSRANYMVEYTNKMLSDPKLKASVREKLQNVLDDVMNNLQLPTGYTFTQLANELDSVSSNLRTINGLVEEFKENGGMTLDNFKELAGILDNIKLEDLYAVSDLDKGINYVDKYIDALDNLELAYDANNGMITMNGKSLQTLQQIQQVQAQAEITNIKNQLIAKKYQTKAEIGYIDAQIEGVKAALAMLETKSASELTAADLTKVANEATQKSFTKTTNDLNKNYATDVQNMNTWTMAVVSNLDTATQAWGKYWAAAAGNEEDLSALLKKAKEGQKDVKFEKVDWFTEAAGKDNKFNQDEVNALKSKLNNQITALGNLKAEYSKNLELYEAEINLLENMDSADLSKFGADDAKKLEKYIGKLKEIYNILNRIQNLEHRLSTLDTYSEIAVGEEYSKYYAERLKYTEELSDQYKFLVTEQKKFANGYMEFIESSAVADVFDFDKFGQIIINFEKYNALQDTAADGEKSLKEQADELYETYTEMYEELQGYFDKYITYLQKAIDLHQEAIDSYVKVENKMADSIKEIYQKMLNTKLEAIDREKEALEELREAREQARKDRDNAKDISGLQTNLQRSMMDTSGASDISFIKAQKDMNDKLEDIAEDKYGEMLDDIIAQLDEEKESLQDNFDQMFENTEWLFAFIEDNIMNDEQKIQEILTQTDEWQQQSNLERKQQLSDLSTDYNKYMEAMRGTEGEEGTIYGVWKKLEELRGATATLDEALKTREVNVGIAVSNAIAEGVKVAAAAYSNGGGGKNNTIIDKTEEENKKTPPTYNDNYNPAKVTTPTWKVSMIGYKFASTKEGKVGDSCTLPTPPAKPDHIFTGWSIDGGNTIRPGSFKPERGSHIATAIYEPITVKWNSSSATSKKPTTDPFPLITGPTLTLKKHAKGGMLRNTGPIWVDGTHDNPEAVLTALQTKHFINFAESLDKMYNSTNGANMSYTGGNVTIGSIEFSVDSMSSVEDGRNAFTAFVDEFKKIGDRTGIKINTFKNTL